MMLIMYFNLPFTSAFTSTETCYPKAGSIEYQRYGEIHPRGLRPSNRYWDQLVRGLISVTLNCRLLEGKGNKSNDGCILQ